MIWALAPARGGSKSIPLKNLLPLAGVPLLDYGIRAAQASASVSRIICSTDDDQIAERARYLGIEVDRRPPHLAGDATPVAEVAIDFLARHGSPKLLVLVQPTSPFLLPEHIDELIGRMLADSAARSGQTVAPCPHNHHAWNQREVAGGYVRFKFPEERRQAYNKQSKPNHYVFGNLIVVRPDALALGDFFAEPSVAVDIPPPYDFDLDTASDVLVAEALLAAGAIRLPHMNTTFPSTR